MKNIKAQLIRRRKRRIRNRLAKSAAYDRGRPMMQGANTQYELAQKTGGTANGGIAAINSFVKKIGLTEAIDRRLNLFKVHAPYHESDHVLNFAYNALCGGTCLQDAFDEVRLDIWKQQDDAFFDQATIEMDGTIVETTGQCKEGMDISYKGIWGYQPLVMTLAETGEVLRIVNRSGNRPSQEGAADKSDYLIALCRQAGFRKIVLRGDTAFTQTAHLDRWDDDDVKFLFGMKAYGNLIEIAENVEIKDWQHLPRTAKYNPQTVDRARPENVKERIVEQRGYDNKRLTTEWVTEVPYRPTECNKTYRLVIVCKELEVTKQGRLFDDYVYFFYLTNETPDEVSTQEVVYSSNQRCDQENVLAQLNPCRALHAPVDNLESNGAFMVMTSLSWNIKAWVGLSLPVDGRWREKHAQERRLVIRMESKGFIEQFVRLPAQIIRSGRQLTVRLLGWSERLDIFNRWLVVALE